MAIDAAVLWNLFIATIGGLAVGIEREWSGHAEGPHARFAGMRTFTMLGAVAGLSGWLWTEGLTGPAIIFLAGLGALVVVAYQAASRNDVDGTTEVAAFVVLAAGVLAGSGHERMASGIIAVTVLLLFEKRSLHGLVSKLDIVEVRAGTRFAVMAAVVLPLLPEGPYGPLGGVRPRQLWALVLFFSALSFVGYLARRLAGRQRGYALAGTIGGLLSSTSVTLTLSRLSRSKPELGVPLASGTLGANAVLFPRVLIATLVLEPALAQVLWPVFVAPFAVGGVLVWRGIRAKGPTADVEFDKNPLQIGAAIQMAVLFQLVLFGVNYASGSFGDYGLYGSAAVLGLTDVDALTVSMARMVSAGTATSLAASALTVGILANTLVKLGIATVIGRGAYRSRAAAGLGLIALTLAAPVVWHFWHQR